MDITLDIDLDNFPSTDTQQAAVKLKTKKSYNGDEWLEMAKMMGLVNFEGQV